MSEPKYNTMVKGKLFQISSNEFSITDDNGDRYWYKGDIKEGKGYFHRLDGPAIEYKDGGKEWWVNGKCHKEDGPAFIDYGGVEYYYLNNIPLTKKEFEMHPLTNKHTLNAYDGYDGYDAYDGYDVLEVF